jgi:hypothetical protein
MQILLKGVPLALVRFEEKTYGDKTQPAHQKIQFQSWRSNGLASVVTVKDEHFYDLKIGKECTIPVEIIAIDGNIYYSTQSEMRETK